LLLGGDFFKQILEFFGLIRTLKPAFAQRAMGVQQLLRLPTTRTITVTTPDLDVFARASELRTALNEAGLHADTLLVNRVIAPAVGMPTDPAAASARTDLDVVRRRQATILDVAGTTSQSVFTLPLLVSDDNRLRHLATLADGLQRHTL
jgi:hypothetical protein